MSKSYLQWLDLSDEAQSRWALQHLVRKQLIEQPEKGVAPETQLQRVIGYLHSPISGLTEADLADLDDKMRGAWGSQKSRWAKAKKGIKPQFIDVDGETRRLLARLCKRKDFTVHELIADLVSREHTLERDAELALKEAKQAIQDKALKRQSRFANKEKDRKIKQLEKELESIWKRVSNLAFEMCASELLAKSGSTTNQLTPELESEAHTKAEVLTKALRQHPAKPATTRLSGPTNDQRLSPTTKQAPPQTQTDAPEAPAAGRSNQVANEAEKEGTDPQIPETDGVHGLPGGSQRRPDHGHARSSYGIKNLAGTKKRNYINKSKPEASRPDRKTDPDYPNPDYSDE